MTTSIPTSHLYVDRDVMTGAWRLYYAVPGETIRCGAEGECSKQLFKRRYQAIAYGERAYQETATPWTRGNAAPTPKVTTRDASLLPQKEG